MKRVCKVIKNVKVVIVKCKGGNIGGKCCLLNGFWVIVIDVDKRRVDLRFYK